MTRSYLVCYDVRDPKRLRKVHKTLMGYGEPRQFSVFWCVLKKIERVRLEEALKAVMNQRDDQVLIVDLGGDEEAARDAVFVLGQGMEEPAGGTVVV